MNKTAIAAIGENVLALKDELTALDGRLDTCARAARAYVDASALHGQIEGESTAQATPGEPKPAAKPPKRSTLKPKPTEPAPTPAPEPDSTNDGGRSPH